MTTRLFTGASQPLDTAIEKFILALYLVWPDLPEFSTQRYVDGYRRQLGALLAREQKDGSSAIEAVRHFLDSVIKLPGVVAATHDTLKNLQGALRSTNASLPAAAGQRLATLLSVGDPRAAVLARLEYADTISATSVTEVRQLLNNAPSTFPQGALQRAQTILQELQTQLGKTNLFGERAVLIKTALRQLEAIPPLVGLLWPALLKAKARPGQGTNRTGGAGLGGLESSHGGEAQAKAPVPVFAPPAPPPPRADAIADSPQPVERAFFSDVRFPGRVKPRERTPLIVRLTRKKQAESVATIQTTDIVFSDPSQPELVDVMVSAPGFSEFMDSWHRTIKVFADDDSQPAVFLLSADEVGKKRVTIDFRHKEKQIGSVAFETEITNDRVGGEAKIFSDALKIDEFMSQPPPPVDLELRIVKGEEDNTLFFTLHSSKPSVGYHWRPMGKKKIVQENPQQFLEYKFERLSEFAQLGIGEVVGDEADDVRKKIEAIGVELWEELLPDTFKTEYWKRIKPLCEKGVIKSLLITSDEPWIPWEMVMPFERDESSDEEKSDGFWGATFQVSRWLAGQGLANVVQIQAARIIAPDLDLAFVEQEVDDFKLLEGRGIKVGDPLKTRREVLKLAENGGVQLVHFAAHGKFDPENPRRSRLSLADDEYIKPEDFGTKNVGGFSKTRPIVFLNACNAGRLALSLTGLGGWVETLIKNARASACIGTLWEVNDELAAAFAQRFYEELFNGKNLGEAMHAARLHIRDKNDTNPTWLAYTLYGDPNSRVGVKNG